jgi:hypothetical protein
MKPENGLLPQGGLDDERRRAIQKATREIDRDLGRDFRRERSRLLEEAGQAIDLELGQVFADERARRLHEAADDLGSDTER